MIWAMAGVGTEYRYQVSKVLRRDDFSGREELCRDHSVGLPPRNTQNTRPPPTIHFDSYGFKLTTSSLHSFRVVRVFLGDLLSPGLGWVGLMQTVGASLLVISRWESPGRQ